MAALCRQTPSVSRFKSAAAIQPSRITRATAAGERQLRRISLPRWRGWLRLDTPARIVTLYVVSSVLWLLLSDQFVSTFIAADLRTAAQSVKGIVFVSLTAFVLLVALVRDHAAMSRSQSTLVNLSNHLEAVLSNAPLAVMTVDPYGNIVTWNTAAERTFGLSAADVVGRPNPIVPAEDTEGYRHSLRTTLAGESMAEHRVSRLRADGSRVELRRWTAPLRDLAGGVVGAVAVFEDITRELSSTAEKDRLMAAIDEEVVRQVHLAAALERMTPLETPEATAQAICAEVCSMEDVETAGILWIGPAGVVPLATVGPASQFVVPDRRLARARAQHVIELAAKGVWTEKWVGGVTSSVDGVSGFRAAGMRAGAYVPIRGDDGPLGILGVGASGEDASERLRRVIPALAQVSSIASALLLPGLRRRAERDTVIERIRAVIARCMFQPVFQPIVELSTDRVVGYEALTRFADGVAPDSRFAEAEAVGLGQELEICCLTAQVNASATLPAGMSLSLNVSPGLVIGSGKLAALLRDVKRPVVLEITEHVAIANYPELRHAVDRLVPRVRLAVDDAGAGFASLRHVVELRPDSVKLDQALVRSIESDPARQALVAGMSHFARQTRAELIAEGIETEAERRTLEALGVEFGQGYLLGRPRPLAQA